MIEYFDSHTHLQFTAYDKDREKVIKRTLQEKVGFINIGTNRKMSEKAVELTEKYKEEPTFATVGLHPIYTYEGPEGLEKFDYEFYKRLASNEKVVAIGECGLDYFRLEGDLEKIEEIKEKQKQALKKQIELSKDAGKPLMVHCRPSEGTNDAYEDIYEIFSQTETVETIMHFFAGSKEMAEKFTALGCYFTFGGVVTLTKSYDEVVKIIPEEKLLLETDAPYVTPASHRGERNEPIFIKETYERISKLKNIPLKEFKEQIRRNNEKIFKIQL